MILGLPRTIRLDLPDRFAFGRPAEPGERADRPHARAFFVEAGEAPAEAVGRLGFREARR